MSNTNSMLVQIFFFKMTLVSVKNRITYGDFFKWQQSGAVQQTDDGNFVHEARRLWTQEGIHWNRRCANKRARSSVHAWVHMASSMTGCKQSLTMATQLWLCPGLTQLTGVIGGYGLGKWTTQSATIKKLPVLSCHFLFVSFACGLREKMEVCAAVGVLAWDVVECNQKRSSGGYYLVLAG